jgi:hypothetical protein
MAEIDTKPAPTALSKPPAQLTDASKMTFEVREFKQDGSSEVLTIPMPDSPDFAKWTMLQQVGMLKRGMWKTVSIADIFWGLSYAHYIGANVMLGELFPTGDGRWGTSNKYKIKQALATGKIKGFTIDIVDTKRAVELAGCVQKTDLECTVTLEVEGFNKPIVRKSLLSRWWNKSNPNWSGRPEHMLELNTFAHACEYVMPGATESDEAPPLQTLQVSGTAGEMVSATPSVKELREQADAEKRRALPADVPLAEVVESTTHPQDQVPV